MNKYIKAIQRRLWIDIYCFYKLDIAKCINNSIPGKYIKQYTFEIVPCTDLKKYLQDIPDDFKKSWKAISGVTDHKAAIILNPEHKVACYQLFTYQNQYGKEFDKTVELSHNEVYFSALRTFPEYRNKGLAIACLNFLIGYLQKTKYSTAIIFTRKSNTAARGVFQKVGFQPSQVYYVFRFFTRKFCFIKNV